MTSRELYENALVELNKVKASSLLLEDYNYFMNKAIQQYVNIAYTRLTNEQQSIDDIRVLKATTILNVNKIDNSLPEDVKNSMIADFYFVDLPMDYLHLLNCIVEYTVKGSKNKCKPDGKIVRYVARSLNSELYTQIMNNGYLKPMYKRPYYHITNINHSAGTYKPYPGLRPATNPIMDESILNYNNGSEDKLSNTAKGENFNNIDNKYAPSNLVDAYNSIGDRLANASVVRMELKVGDESVYIPTKVYVDYIKAPMYVKLTQDHINSILDYSQVLEFPDYVCYEIINIFVRLVMENTINPRLQSNIPINDTIQQKQN